MIPSPLSFVPLFHSLGGGTVEQTLKALADKVLERNKRGTTVSRSVPRRLLEACRLLPERRHEVPKSKDKGAQPFDFGPFRGLRSGRTA
jgi:hypothetical protein